MVEICERAVITSAKEHALCRLSPLVRFVARVCAKRTKDPPLCLVIFAAKLESVSGRFIGRHPIAARFDESQKDRLIDSATLSRHCYPIGGESFTLPSQDPLSFAFVQ